MLQQRVTTRIALHNIAIEHVLRFAFLYLATRCWNVLFRILCHPCAGFYATVRLNTSGVRLYMV